MQQVCINAERRFAAFVFGNRNLMFLGETNQLGTAGQIPFAPGCNNLDIWVQRIGRQFKTHLIVALACCAVGHRIRTRFRGNFNQTF